MSNFVINPSRFVADSIEECWWVDDIDDAANFDSVTPTNRVIGSSVENTSNPMYNWGTVKKVAAFLCCPSTLSGGTFRTGVWDEDGDLKAQSSTFDCSDMAVGSSSDDFEKLSRSLTSSTTIATGDRVGVICNSAPTGTGEIKLGQKDSVTANWKRVIFIQGSASVSEKSVAVAVCLST